MVDRSLGESCTRDGRLRMRAVAKAGGLGDVVFGLSRELEIRGHAVEIVLPKYGCMRHEECGSSTPVTTISGCHGRRGAPLHGVVRLCARSKCYFIEPHPIESSSVEIAVRPL